MKQRPLNYTKRVMSAIRMARRVRDYSQEYMAISLGISQNAYSKLEAGKTPLTLDRLLAISSILGVTPEEIFMKFDMHPSNEDFN